MDFRPVFLIAGVMLSALAVAMLIPAIVDGIAGKLEWQTFLISAAVTMFVGVALVLSCRVERMILSLRQAFVMISLIWIMITLFASIPFVFSEFNLSFTDAYFEAMSGITTTGSTVIVGLDQATPGFLLWRGILQWIGGLGIIVMSISVLPWLRVGGMQLFRIEAFETEGKMFPRAAQISSGVTVIFIAITFTFALALWLAGMSGLEAVVHAMTTIATGGYSTSDASIGHFDSPLIEAIITVGMVIGGIPFVLYLKLIHGDTSRLIKDEQVRWYLSILLLATAAIFLWLLLVNNMNPLQALRYAPFTVVSIMTGTGYTSVDYNAWGAFPVGLFFFLTFVGGCAGSTACGMKVFRFQVLYSISRREIHKLLQPHGVFISYYNKRPISDEVSMSVLSYFFIFGVCFAVLSVGLSLTGLDFVTALSSAATAMANVGPGLGTIVGPSDTFQSLPGMAKWLLAAGMLIGRLEVFAVIVILTPSFWRD